MGNKIKTHFLSIFFFLSKPSLNFLLLSILIAGGICTPSSTFTMNRSDPAPRSCLKDMGINTAREHIGRIGYDSACERYGNACEAHHKFESFYADLVPACNPPLPRVA